MIGRTLGHYRIIALLGSGGMGEVYRARDERLQREVAIKVLPATALHDEAARRRFRREALALSQLNHPHIATVHDFDQEEGVDFLVMELVQGESLVERSPYGPLAADDVVKLGEQLAAALEAAHAKGIVHRDLKPANLVVTHDGRLKVLDFGLARLLTRELEPQTTALTEPLSMIGTMPYMPPESFRGERADERGDIYSAGAVLYELATGHRPFVEDNAASLIYAILNQPPEPPTLVNRVVPPGLESVILKTLEKDPKMRYQSARELRVDLERLRVTPGAVAVRSRPGAWPWRAVAGIILGAVVTVLVIWDPFHVRERLHLVSLPVATASLAVLPLENSSSNPDEEFFAEGMTEELTTALSKISALTVIAPGSVKSFKGASTPLREIGKTLHVGMVVQGAVARAGDKVRVAARLIDVSSGRYLWAESYVRNLRDVLNLQGEVALAIAHEIQVRLTPRERIRLMRKRQVDPGAHDECLLGRYLMSRLTQHEGQKAIEHFQKAIAIDPMDAAAYAGLAESYYLISNWWLAPAVAMPRARAAALKALELDEDRADAHSVLGMVQAVYEWHFEGGIKELKRATELNPSSATAQFYYGYLVTLEGQYDQARRALLRAVELDPLNTTYRWISIWPLYYQKRYNEAIRELQDVTRDDPRLSDGFVLLGEVYEQLRDYSRAIENLRHARQLGTHAWGLAALARVQARAGRADSARAILAQLEKTSRSEYVTPYGIATVQAALGDKDRAYALLEKGIAEHCEDLTFLKIDPRIAPLRGDPRFAELLRRVGFAS